MAAYKMAAIKVTPPTDVPLGLIRSHMVVINLFLVLCDLQRVVRDLRPTLYTAVPYFQMFNLEPRFPLSRKVFWSFSSTRADFFLSV
jgi:hypothetical protein